LSRAVRIDSVGGGRDEGQFAVQTLVQPLDQAGAEDNFRTRWGDIKFSG